MRPHEHEQWSYRQLYGAYCLSIAIGCIVVSVALAIIALAFFGSLRASAADHPLCTYFAELSKEPGVQVAEWVGYPGGWKDYPREWDYETYTPLAGESGILSRVSGRTTWLFGFRTLIEDNGHHDFCPHVLIVSEAP